MASRPEYQSLEDMDDHIGGTHEDAALLGGEDDDGEQVPFSWIEYGIFCFLGMAMLWAWYEPPLLLQPVCLVSHDHQAKSDS